MAQLQLRLHGVVYAAEEHGLVVHRDARPQQFVAGLSGLRCYLVRVVEMGVHPYRPVLGQHRTELVINTLWQYHREPGPDSDHLHMLYLSQAGQDFFQASCGKCQRVTTGDHHIADARGLADVVQHPLDLLGVMHPSTMAPFPLSGAVTTQHGADVGQHHEDPIRVSMDQPWDRGMPLLIQRVLHAHAGQADLLE